MIRIDELYDNTFWPWMQEHLPGTRMFYCDPPGHTGVENLFNRGEDFIVESDYIFLHDQEPVDIKLYQQLFDDVIRRNDDIQPKAQGGIIVSEKGEFVSELCSNYNWRSYYYFWHGWAALDWYRGYNRTFLIKRADKRTPTKTFMSPNRIIGGNRDHRVLFLYEVFKRNLQNNHISAPRTCPVEHTDITHIASKYTQYHPNITHVLATEKLPIRFPYEDVQKMSSCWLDNFDAAADSMFYVPTETVYFGKRLHITEKTFKAIALEMPFILIAPAHSLEYLHSYGFQTFSNIIDESYDSEENDIVRVQKVGQLLEDINNLSKKEKQSIWKHCLPSAIHNYNHFYSGAFEQILWKELTSMLNQIKQDYV
jgi:hypothetical protein